jgi:hypothetical protein
VSHTRASHGRPETGRRGDGDLLPLGGLLEPRPLAIELMELLLLLLLGFHPPHPLAIEVGLVLGLLLLDGLHEPPGLTKPT